MIRLAPALLLVAGCAADPCAGTDTCLDLEVVGDVGPVDTLSMSLSGAFTRDADAALPPPAAPPPFAVGVVLPPTANGVLHVSAVGLLTLAPVGVGATDATVSPHGHARAVLTLVAPVAPDGAVPEDLAHDAAAADLAKPPDLSGGSAQDASVAMDLASAADLTGADMSCVSPFMLCQNMCIDPQSDPDNCGNCGNFCAAPNAIGACKNGACVFSCIPGFGDCDSLPGNGCELSLTSDRHHCGSCTTDCTDGSAGGKCIMGACGCETSLDCSATYADQCVGNACMCGNFPACAFGTQRCRSGVGLCLLVKGQPCAADADCYSGSCPNGICQ
jgi:hypothetical protein